MAAPRRLRVILALAGGCLMLTSSLLLIRHVHQEAKFITIPLVQEGWRPTEPSNALILHSHDSRVDNSTQSKASLGNKTMTTTTDFQETTSNTSNTTIHPLDRIKVPFPIFVASLPKSGTTSTARYFHCGRIWTAHTFVNTVGTTHQQKQMRVGHCMLNNIQAGRAPLHDCGNYKVWSDAGHPRGTPCFYPSVHGLNEFYAAYPHATILLVTRNSTAWAKSVQRWKNGQLVKKWRRCQHFPSAKHVSAAELEQFYSWHVQSLRNFASQHPSLTFVEVSLEDETIGQQLENRIGVPAECFKHHNSHEKRLRLNPKFRQEFSTYQKELQQI